MDGATQSTIDTALHLQRSPAGEILRLLQRHGPLTIKQLQAELGVRSLNAVREQLTHLSAAGLITSTAQRQGAGRPAYVYALSERAQALFPNGYDVLLKVLLEELAAREGDERLQQILSDVGTRLADQYGGQGGEFEQRLQTLVQTSETRGTPIKVYHGGEVTTLHKFNCPYFDLAKTTTAVCAVEQRMIEQVLGQHVQLTERIVDGHPGCCFVVDAPSDAEDAAEA
jgi:predicted ArsR family transcriptional regulator